MGVCRQWNCVHHCGSIEEESQVKGNFQVQTWSTFFMGLSARDIVVPLKLFTGFATILFKINTVRTAAPSNERSLTAGWINIAVPRWPRLLASACAEWSEGKLVPYSSTFITLLLRTEPSLGYCWKYIFLWKNWLCLCLCFEILLLDRLQYTCKYR